MHRRRPDQITEYYRRCELDTGLDSDPLPQKQHELPDGPKSPPEPPETWTEETAQRYAATYEERRMYNSMYGTTVDEITVECSVQEVESVRGGYRVVVLRQGAAYYGDDGRHGDYVGAPITYLVGNGAAIRTARHDARY
ncbi:hypothetical protein [Halorussus ruber]|uniref:hypothetical protein n=1 Tax=Halorussus ruber TaxID=1126238 RepID=UPI001091FCF8|nr:hypothetical protein [Halorussus ruber]